MYKIGKSDILKRKNIFYTIDSETGIIVEKKKEKRQFRPIIVPAF